MDAITLWQLITHPRVKKAGYIMLRLDVCVLISIEQGSEIENTFHCTLHLLFPSIFLFYSKADVDVASEH